MQEQQSLEAEPAKKGMSASVMSKKRYFQIITCIEDKLKDKIDHEVFCEVMEQIANDIKHVMHFDPESHTYNQQVNERNKKWRIKKANEIGTSTYVTSGRKRYYERTHK